MTPPLSYLNDEGERLYRWGLIAKQAEVWIDRYGREHRIAEMPPDYAQVAWEWFRDHQARRLFVWEKCALAVTLATASIDETVTFCRDLTELGFDGALDDPTLTYEDWAEDTPLGAALRRRAAE